MEIHIDSEWGFILFLIRGKQKLAKLAYPGSKCPNLVSQNSWQRNIISEKFCVFFVVVFFITTGLIY